MVNEFYLLPTACKESMFIYISREDASSLYYESCFINQGQQNSLKKQGDPRKGIICLKTCLTSLSLNYTVVPIKDITKKPLPLEVG